MSAALARMLGDALATGDDGALRRELVTHSRLPGPRLNLCLVASFAIAVGDVATRRDPPVDALEALLDGWAAVDIDAATADSPEVILPCAAVAAYGELGAVRPEWFGDEVGKLRRAAADPRWRVRELVAQALQRLLAADWSRTVAALREWADDDDPLVLRAVAAAVAEPALRHDDARSASAAALQQLVVERFSALAAGPHDQRRRRGRRDR